MIIFSHIPKTGGITFNRILDAQYPKGRIFQVDGTNVAVSLKHFKSLNCRRYDVLRGHFSFGIHKEIGVQGQYVTWVRDPVNRLISMYYHILRSPDHSLYSKLSKGISLVDFVTSGITGQTNNGQIKQIAGIKSRDMDAVLELAKKNIRKHFIFVGITEEYGRSLKVLYRRTSWNRVRCGKKNVGRNKRDVSMEDRKVIGEFNKWDLELVKYADSILV